MMTTYEAYLSPPQLFVGSKIKHRTPKEAYELGAEETYWEQEPIEVSIQKLKSGIETLGIQCLDIKLGTYDETEGVLEITSMTCEYDGSNAVLLKSLLEDEAYITTGITSSEPIGIPPYYLAIYFKA